MKPYPATTIANEFLQYSFDEEHWINHLKLQRLVYLAHGWCLGLEEEPLIKEDIVAYQYVPIIFELYDQFIGYGLEPIASLYSPPIKDLLPAKTLSLQKSDTLFYGVVEKIWDVFKSWTSGQLAVIGHGEGTPWDIVKNNNQTIISHKILRDHFKKLSNCGLHRLCCGRAGEHNGFGSGPLVFTCPKHCVCHD